MSPLKPPSAITVGTFDGVHRGHRLVLDRMVASARAGGLRSVMLTFEPHPLAVINPGSEPALLTTPAEKHRVLEARGLDSVVTLPFTPLVQAMAAEEFVERVLIGEHGLRELHIGHDHGFGRGRAGDAAALRVLGAARGFTVHVVPPVEAPDGNPVSSTAIRRAIEAGDTTAATDGLGRPYAMTGTVVRGESRGASLGFRTLNLDLPDPRKLMPADGIYAVRATTVHGAFGGMMHLGPRPTYDDSRRVIEVHLFDAAGDWYGTDVTVHVVARMRPIATFESGDALTRQIRADEEGARTVLGRVPAGR